MKGRRTSSNKDLFNEQQSKGIVISERNKRPSFNCGDISKKMKS